MATIEERFAHISDERKAEAVAGFVRANPHQRGIWFDDMMELILDSDAHMSIVGDVVVEGEAATKLVDYLADLQGWTL